MLLINGRPADGDASIQSYPAEALERLGVLKPEAAARYGYPAGRRVVNLVLKPKFASTNVDAGVSWATAGGQYGGTLNGGRYIINGETRWSMQARTERQSALLKSDRAIPPRPGVFDDAGFVSAPGGGEIDPALSAAAGETVSTAAIPAGGFAHPPGLADFVAGANATDPVDPNDYETLRPSRRSTSLSAGVTRPIGAFSASLTLNASTTGSDGMRGLPMASLTLPAGSLWSPFASPVVLTRPFAGERALRADNSAQSVGASFSMNGRIGDWRTSTSVNYARNWSDAVLELGIDNGRMQALLDGGDASFNPYGPLGRNLLNATRNRSRSETISARVNIGKPIMTLPAGQVTANFSLDVNHNRYVNRRTDYAGAVDETDRNSRGQANWQGAVSVPLSRRRPESTGPGDVSIDLQYGGQAVSGSGVRQRYGAAANWTPSSLLRLRGAIDHAETAPSPDQLNGPVITNLIRVFDYARQEVVDVISTTGGNPNLPRGKQRTLNVTARVTPLGDETLALNVGYRQQTARGGITALPELTPAIEAAFPDRVTRDPQGRLIALDARPIAIAYDTTAELTSGLAVRLPRRAKIWPAGAPGAKPRAPLTDPWQFTLAVNHTWRLKSELLTAPGLPVIDRFAQGGSSRHSITVQATAGKRGLGASLNGNWSNPYRVLGAGSGAGTAQNIRFKPPFAFNLSAFAEPEHVFAGVGKSSWLANLRVSLDIQNVLRGYRRAIRDDGTVPIGYTRDEVDPLGRTMRLTVRKRF